MCALNLRVPKVCICLHRVFRCSILFKCGSMISFHYFSQHRDLLSTRCWTWMKLTKWEGGRWSKAFCLKAFLCTCLNMRNFEWLTQSPTTPADVLAINGQKPANLGEKTKAEQKEFLTVPSLKEHIKTRRWQTTATSTAHSGSGGASRGIMAGNLTHNLESQANSRMNHCTSMH